MEIAEFGKQTKVNIGAGKQEFYFYHGDTVPEHVAVSLEFEDKIIPAQRAFLKTLPASDADYLYRIVTAHTAANILPGMEFTYPEE